MADYEIDLNSLNSKKEELNSLKANIDNIYNEFTSSYLSKLSGTDISTLTNKIKTPLDRIKKGYNNSNTWLNKYITELNTLESSLANFKGASVTTPTEFKGEFTDLFGKVTMPVLKTNGDQLANYNTFGAGSEVAQQIEGNTNKDKVYNYLASQGFNNAAICGILANIQHESNFNPHSLGDNGTSYGICQWHNSRWTNLKKYCKKNNLDSTTLEGQVSYLVHELKTNYPKVYNTIKNVPNTKEGAYNAAYAWTVHYEVPANRYTQGDRRGKTASTTYWNTYGAKT